MHNKLNPKHHNLSRAMDYICEHLNIDIVLNLNIFMAFIRTCHFFDATQTQIKFIIHITGIGIYILVN